LSAAIQFDGVSKKFILHHERARSFQELVVGLFRRNNRSREEFWALRDVSFAVERGETVGIIGPNGAGKSTVLKLISRIIEPTSGQIAVRGRIGALLELGAGFHPDLTGRENIYLNGSILGLSRAEIRRRLDDIIGFAELERFIDVPVKHYSSGMFVRLGFSVAVHTDPEILLVDEVLAVGDQAFQRKCIEQIMEFRCAGCTVVLVSHDLQMIQHLCSRVLWLDQGRLMDDGETDQVIARYINIIRTDWEKRLDSEHKGITIARERKPLQIQEVKMLDSEGHPRWVFPSGQPLRIQIAYECIEPVERPVFSILIHRSDGLYVSSTNTFNIDPTDIGPIQGRGVVSVDIERLDLYEGDYLLSVGAYLEPDPPFWSQPADFRDKQYRFRVISPKGTHGVLVLPARWECRPCD